MCFCSSGRKRRILNTLGCSLPLAVDVSLQTVAAQTEHFTGADLKALLYNAQLLAANQALQTSQNRLSSLTGDAEKTLSEESDDSGYGKRNSIASSISSNSERTHAVSQQTDSHSKQHDRARTRPDQLIEKERMWEFHMSGEHLKQETILQVPKEVSSGRDNVDRGCMLFWCFSYRLRGYSSQHQETIRSVSST